MNLKNGRMVKGGEITLWPEHPAGLISLKGSLLVITWKRSALGTSYFLLRIDPVSGDITERIRIKDIFEPAHMVWDGDHLWVTSWYSQKIYKVDLETEQVISSFQSPAPKTTGITFDGRYFWVTGTHADLYKVELMER